MKQQQERLAPRMKQHQERLAPRMQQHSMAHAESAHGDRGCACSARSRGGSRRKPLLHLQRG
jgi:hypothetical protein